MTVSPPSRLDRLDAFATELFAAFVRGDLAQVRSMFTGDGRFVCERLGIDLPIDAACERLAGVQGVVGERAHDDVRRLLLDDAFVEQHRVVWRDAEQHDIAVDVCSVARVVPDDGRYGYLVTSFEEYLGEARGAAAPDDARTVVQRNVLRHVESEFTNDVDQIVATVSGFDVYFPQVRDTGSEFRIVTALDRDGAVRFYTLSRDLYQAIRSTNLTAVYTSWYAFRVAIGELAPVHPQEGAVAPSVQVHTATIFPVARDGIIGEISVAERSIEELFAGAPAIQESAEERRARMLRNEALFNRFVQAWRAGDLSALDGVVDPRPCCITRGVRPSDDHRTYRELTERDDVMRSYAQPEDEIMSIRVVNRIVESWYVFAEYEIVLANADGGAGSGRRMVAVYPITPRGLIGGELSYVVDGPVFDLG